MAEAAILSTKGRNQLRLPAQPQAVVPAWHGGVSPQPPRPGGPEVADGGPPAWRPNSPALHQGAAVAGGLRHNALEPYVGAAADAAGVLGDSQLANRGNGSLFQ